MAEKGNTEDKLLQRADAFFEKATPKQLERELRRLQTNMDAKNWRTAMLGLYLPHKLVRLSPQQFLFGFVLILLWIALFAWAICQGINVGIWRGILIAVLGGLVLKVLTAIFVYIVVPISCEQWKERYNRLVANQAKQKANSAP